MTIEKIIQSKVFRVTENMRKVKFIIENSGITEETIIKAATIARPNAYHNFGHQLGVAEYGIKIAIAEKRKISEINTIGIAGIIHDAGHHGYMRAVDELYSLDLASKIMEESDLVLIEPNQEKSFGILRDLVMATVFASRGKVELPLAKILQDADLAHLGQGPIYWLWASMGLIEEFSKQRGVKVYPLDFIYNEQEVFVDLLTTMSPTGSVWLSHGANRIFNNPLQDVQTIKNLPEEAIYYAYEVRHQDITLEEFEKKILSF